MCTDSATIELDVDVGQSVVTVQASRRSATLTESEKRKTHLLLLLSMVSFVAIFLGTGAEVRDGRGLGLLVVMVVVLLLAKLTVNVMARELNMKARQCAISDYDRKQHDRLLLVLWESATCSSFMQDRVNHLWRKEPTTTQISQVRDHSSTYMIYKYRNDQLNPDSMRKKFH